MTKYLAWNFSLGKTSQRGRGGNQFMVQLWWVFPLGRCLDYAAVTSFSIQVCSEKRNRTQGKGKDKRRLFL